MTVNIEQLHKNGLGTTLFIYNFNVECKCIGLQPFGSTLLLCEKQHVGSVPTRKLQYRNIFLFDKFIDEHVRWLRTSV